MIFKRSFSAPSSQHSTRSHGDGIVGGVCLGEDRRRVSVVEPPDTLHVIFHWSGGSKRSLGEVDSRDDEPTQRGRDRMPIRR